MSITFDQICQTFCNDEQPPFDQTQNFSSNQQTTTIQDQFSNPSMSSSSTMFYQQQNQQPSMPITQVPPLFHPPMPEFCPPNVYQILDKIRPVVSNNDIENSLIALTARQSSDTPVDLIFEQLITQLSLAKSRAFEKQLFTNGNQELVYMFDSIFNMYRHLKQQLQDVRQASCNNLSLTISKIQKEKEWDEKRKLERRRKTIENPSLTESEEFPLIIDLQEQPQQPEHPEEYQQQYQEQPLEQQHQPAKKEPRLFKSGKPASYAKINREVAPKAKKERRPYKKRQNAK